MVRAAIVIAALVLAVPMQAQKPAPASKPATTAGDKIFDLTRVHRIRISIPAAEWAVLMTSGGRSNLGPGGADYTLDNGRLAHLSSGFANYLPWAHADFRIEGAGGAEFKNVGIRYKGNSSFSRSSSAAPLLANFKLKIDLYGTKGSWDGERTFNFQSGVVDTSRMRDSVAYWAFRAAGVPAPRTTYAELIFNVPGIYQDTSAGLFTIIEDVNKTFLERVMAPGTGLLMKPEQLGGGIRSLGESWAQYAPKLRPDRDATAHEQQRVMEFSRLISQPDVALFREKLGTYLDVDAFLRFIFVNAFIGNWDSYLTGGHNFYFYLDPSDDRFRFVPWDMDLSLSRGGFGGAAIRIVRADGTVVNGVGNAVTVVNGNTFTFVNGTATVNGAEMGGARAPAMPGTDIMAPGNRSQMLITKVLDDPAWAERYREIIRELSTTVFSAAELTKLMDALEGVNKGAPNSPREFLLGRAKVLQDLIASWEK